MQSRKKKAVLIFERPVLLPDSIPAADSAKLLTVVIPNNEPKIVAEASTRKTLLKAGKLPSSSRRLALFAIARPVPRVPKKSLIRSMRMNGTN